jgi:hypothetical protein
VFISLILQERGHEHIEAQAGQRIPVRRDGRAERVRVVEVVPDGVQQQSTAAPAMPSSSAPRVRMGVPFLLYPYPPGVG